jgi:hypothetical protein
MRVSDYTYYTHLHTPTHTYIHTPTHTYTYDIVCSVVCSSVV